MTPSPRPLPLSTADISRMVAACEADKVSLVKPLLKDPRLATTPLDDQRRQALHLVAVTPGISGRAVTAALLAAGAAVDATDADGFTPLALAARASKTGLVGDLLNAGAAVDARCNHGATPLLIAAETARASVVERLIQGGADVGVVLGDGRTALVVAALNKSNAGPVVDLLLAAGAPRDWSGGEDR
eukprot:contig_11592_g2765